MIILYATTKTKKNFSREPKVYGPDTARWIVSKNRPVFLGGRNLSPTPLSYLKTAWYLVYICTVLSKWEIYRWDVARVTAKCVNETQNNINYRANIIFQLHIFFLKLLSSKKK